MIRYETDGGCFDERRVTTASRDEGAPAVATRSLREEKQIDIILN